jgi:2,5-diketo-D-gluconate reductase A
MHVLLNSGATMPQLGFGCMMPRDLTAPAVQCAIDVGYRSLDTAAAYGNEAEVGRAIVEADVPRGELFLTTKLWNSEHGRERTLRAFEASLAELGVDYVDLYLIHWPVPATARYVETWQTLVELAEGGRARSIGVSNFQIHHLEEIIAKTGVAPAVNQIELHPMFQQRELRDFHAHTGIVTEAWSPLGEGRALSSEVVGEIGAGHSRSASQVLVRWHLQLGNVVIPKSATPERIAENFAVFDFELNDADMERVRGLESGQRVGPDPDYFIDD